MEMGAKLNFLFYVTSWLTNVMVLHLSPHIYSHVPKMNRMCSTAHVLFATQQVSFCKD